MMNEVVQTGRTVAEAEEQALAALGADRSEVAVEVLNRGRQGFLGIGGELAEVRVTRLTPIPPEPAEPEPAPEAESEFAPEAAPEPALELAVAEDDAPGAVLDFADDIPEDNTPAGIAIHAVTRILNTIGTEVTVTLRSEYDEFAGGPVIDISGIDSGLLIGRRGHSLQSLQFIVQCIVRQQLGRTNIRVALDVEQYRRRREESLREMADRVADRVGQTGRGIPLEPMPPSDRRVIHLHLDGREGVRTESIGSGEDRKIQILPDRQ